MSIGLSFSNPIISFKIFNFENKSKPSRSNKLSCFKYFSRFKHFSFKSTHPNNFNNNFDSQTQDNNFDSQTNDSNSNLKLTIMRTKLQDKMILILKIYTIQSNGKILIQN